MRQATANNIMWRCSVGPKNKSLISSFVKIDKSVNSNLRLTRMNAPLPNYPFTKSPLTVVRLGKDCRRHHSSSSEPEKVRSHSAELSSFSFDRYNIMLRLNVMSTNRHGIPRITNNHHNRIRHCPLPMRLKDETQRPTILPNRSLPFCATDLVFYDMLQG